MRDAGESSLSTPVVPAVSKTYSRHRSPGDFCSIGVPGEGVEPSWGRSGGGFEPRLYRSARAHGGHRMAQSVAGRWVGEGKGVKDSQHFLVELRDFQVVAGPNSHHFHGFVASFGRPSPRRPQSATEGLEIEVGERVSPRHLVLISSSARLPRQGESGHWREPLSPPRVLGRRRKPDSNPRVIGNRRPIPAAGLVIPDSWSASAVATS